MTSFFAERGFCSTSSFKELGFCSTLVMLFVPVNWPQKRDESQPAPGKQKSSGVI
jgi:hypothetical protein